MIPVIAKIFESVVYDQLYEYFEVNGLLSPVQSSFRSGHSTQDVLLKFVDDWKIALDKGLIVGTVMVDLSKAFDSIDHSLLLSKLQALGIEGSELAWFADYLKGKQQSVVINSVPSQWKQVIRGVPQGSMLEPLLLLVFVNNLPKVVHHCTVNLYTDDTAIYTSDENPQW